MDRHARWPSHLAGFPPCRRPRKAHPASEKTANLILWTPTGEGGSGIQFLLPQQRHDPVQRCAEQSPERAVRHFEHLRGAFQGRGRGQVGPHDHPGQPPVAGGDRQGFGGTRAGSPAWASRALKRASSSARPTKVRARRSASRPASVGGTWPSLGSGVRLLRRHFPPARSGPQDRMTDPSGRRHSTAPRTSLVRGEGECDPVRTPSRCAVAASRWCWRCRCSGRTPCTGLGWGSCRRRSGTRPTRSWPGSGCWRSRRRCATA